MKKLTLKSISVLCALLLCLSAAVTAVPLVSAAGTAVTSKGNIVYLRGTFNGWEAPDEYKMTEDNNRHYLITISLKKGSYEYKAATKLWAEDFQAPVEGNASLTLSSDCDVTFVVDINSNSIQAYPHSSLSAGKSKVMLKSKWMEHSDLVLVQKDNKVSYESESLPCLTSAYWNIISNGSGAFYLQNDTTKDYAALSGSDVICVKSASDGNTSWNVDTSTGAARFVSTADSNAVINVENLSGSAQGSSVPMYYTSSQWEIVDKYYDYTLRPDKVIDAGYNAVANSATSITSYASGTTRKWTKSKDLSKYPQLSAPNSPLAAAVYNLTLEEAVKSIYTDGSGRELLMTGTNWQKVWTRDTALSNLYSLSWIFPEISYNCEQEKIKTSGGVSVFEQDTGTGGSYPVSTDKIITMLSVWETYLTDGNKEHLNYFYDICKNTIMQDMNVAYDKDAELFRGETCGLDWRDQTYPDWTSETYDSGLSTIAESKTTSVNTIYCRVLEIMSKAAKVLGKGSDAEQAWAKMAEDLKQKVSERLWNENMGLYSSWEYPEYMGSVLAEKTDVLGNGFALWFDIGTDSQLDSIMKNSPLVNYGADTVYPQKIGKLANANKNYHNFGVWPGWQSILMVGAAYHNNKALAEEIFNSNVRGAATSLTQKEVINYRTGEGVESDQQLWSVAGSLAGYYRVMFGLNYDESGITFNPYIPSWMKGPFELSNFKYRNANLTINLSGEGDKVTSFKVDGETKDINSYVFPVDATGSHTIEIVMEKSGAAYEINKSDKNLAACPEMPTTTYSNGKINWTPQEGLTYKLWTGKEYIDVSGGSYAVDRSVYGCYSLMAISADGLCSELSKPIVVSVSPVRITVEAESGAVSDSSCISSGLVIDKYTKKANLTISVDIKKKGIYQLSGIYNNSGDATSGISCAVRSVYVDGEDKGTLVFPEVYSNHKNQTSTHLTLDLDEGVHTVKIFYDNANWYDRNMSISGNNVEYNYFNFDYTGERKQAETSEASASEAQTSESAASEQSTSEAQSSEAAASEQASTSEAASSEQSTSEAQASEAAASEQSASEAQASEAASSEQSASEAQTSEAAASEQSTSEAQASEVAVSEQSTSEAQASEAASSEQGTSESGKPEAPTARISKTKASLNAGGTLTLNVTNGKVKSWTSSSKKVAAVKNGKVTALKKGAVIIAAKLTTGVTLKCKVTIKTSPKLSKKSVTVKKGKTVKVKIKGKAKAVNNKYTKTKYAKITSKKSAKTITVKGLKKGKTTLKVKVNGVVLKLKVKVK